MGKVTGFKEFNREVALKREIGERTRDFKELYLELPQTKAQEQGARCMDCGVPFCHTGCPVNNVIPDWNDLVYKGHWREALRILHSTNNFPEFTGRICPAPCETACVLGINEPPVTIKQIEKMIVDRGWREGWIIPEPATKKTGKKVAVVGSGPAGLAAAQQLARAGHDVTVFEKNETIGGLLRLGIPDFKLEKVHIDRRIAQMTAEGVEFITNAFIGQTVSLEELRGRFEAILLSGGAEKPRDLNVPGRGLKGIHFAMDFLAQQNRKIAGEDIPAWDEISAKGKNVMIIGGGDTGADCLGTSIRQGAKSIKQFELMPQPPAERSEKTPWPLWPLQLRTETSHEEGGDRLWSISTLAFEGDKQGCVKALKATSVGTPPKFEPIEGSEQAFDAELILLAMGFTGPVKEGLIDQLGVDLDSRGIVKTDDTMMTSVSGVFAAGDMQRGQSLVVHAIASGRKAAEGIDRFLRGKG